MALCVQQSVIYAHATNGAAADSAFTVFMPLSPQPANISGCTESVILSSVDYSSYVNNPWTLEDAQAFIGAAALVWGLAWIFRQAIDFILNRRG